MSMARFMEIEAEELQLLIEEKDSTNTKRNTKAEVKLLREYCFVDMFLVLYVVTNQLLMGDSGLQPSCNNVISCVGLLVYKSLQISKPTLQQLISLERCRVYSDGSKIRTLNVYYS